MTVTPLTLPAHASLLTGTFPGYHGLRDNGGAALADSQTTLADVLRARGYRTGGFVAAFLGPALLGLALWRQLRLDEFFGARIDAVPADVPWSRVAALLAINRLCAPGSELAIEERWYPTTALDDLLHIPEGTINDSRLYRALDHVLPHKAALERHLTARYGALFAAEFDRLAV